MADILAYVKSHVKVLFSSINKTSASMSGNSISDPLLNSGCKISDTKDFLDAGIIFVLL